MFTYHASPMKAHLWEPVHVPAFVLLSPTLTQNELQPVTQRSVVCASPHLISGGWVMAFISILLARTLKYSRLGPRGVQLGLDSGHLTGLSGKGILKGYWTAPGVDWQAAEAGSSCGPTPGGLEQTADCGSQDPEGVRREEVIFDSDSLKDDWNFANQQKEKASQEEEIA